MEHSDRHFVVTYTPSFVHVAGEHLLCGTPGFLQDTNGVIRKFKSQAAAEKAAGDLTLKIGPHSHIWVSEFLSGGTVYFNERTKKPYRQITWCAARP